MSLIDILFGKKTETTAVAHGRLRTIITQECARSASVIPDYLPTLYEELLEVLSKYVNVSFDDIHISREKQDGVDVLELNIILLERKKV